MNNIIDPVPAIECAAFFEAEGLPELPLPASLLPTMRSQGGHRFASPGWVSAPSLQDSALRWLQAAGPQSSGQSSGHSSGHSSGYCAIVPRGVHSSRAEVAFVSARCGFFVGKLMSDALQDGAVQRRKLEGSFKLMKRLIDSAGAATTWPAGKRLVVVDEDGQALRWGWVPQKRAQWSELTPDSMAWVSALISIMSARSRG